MSSLLPDFTFRANEEQIADLMRRVPAYQAALHTQPRANIRTFLIRFDNNKKRGAGRPVQVYENEGVVFSSGRVIIDTEAAVQKGYDSVEQMQEELERYGQVTITWLED